MLFRTFLVVRRLEIMDLRLLLGQLMTDSFNVTYEFGEISNSQRQAIIRLVFSSFKIGNLLGVKDPIPGGLRSRVVYKFVCAGCNAC